jgi:hypothetical protein
MVLAGTVLVPATPGGPPQAMSGLGRMIRVGNGLAISFLVSGMVGRCRDAGVPGGLTRSDGVGRGALHQN